MIFSYLSADIAALDSGKVPWSLYILPLLLHAVGIWRNLLVLDRTLHSTVPLPLSANAKPDNDFENLEPSQLWNHLHRQWTSSYLKPSVLTTHWCLSPRSGIPWVHGWGESVWTATPNADRVTVRTRLPVAYFGSSRMQATSVPSTQENLYLHPKYTAILDITPLWFACVQGSLHGW